MKHPDLTPALDSNARIETMLANGNVSVVDACDRDSTDDDCTDHDDRHPPLRLGVDADGDAAVTREKASECAARRSS
jgi:hypothetical protein